MLDWRLGVAASPIEASHTATETLAATGETIDARHRQTSFILDARLMLDLGLVPWLALQVELPGRLFDTSIRYEDLAGNTIAIEGADVHHRDETLVGLGDPLFGARAATRLDRWYLEGRAGLRLPLGGTEPNPYTPEAETRRHEHFQFGTGTFDPEVGLTVEHRFEDWTLGLWGFARWALYQNSHGFRAGDRYAGGLYAATGFGLDDWRFSLMADVQGERPERWDGAAPTDDGNQGRVDVFGGLGVDYRGDGWHLGVNLRTPLYSHIVGGQLDLPVVIELSVGGTLDLWADPFASDHGAVVQGDVADAVEPTPVPGKITVVDYWAEWCLPCKRLRELLDTVARGHAWVAVRRIDLTAGLPDGIAKLPYVEVFDGSGMRIYVGHGDPDAIAADVESIAHGRRPPSR